jgi:hypothetical protein
MSLDKPLSTSASPAKENLNTKNPVVFRDEISVTVLDATQNPMLATSVVKPRL